MNYNFTLLTSKADVLKLVALATAEKDDLEFRKAVLLRKAKNSADSSNDIEADIQRLNSDITVTETIIATLPDGDKKTEENIKLMGFEYKKAKLLQRRNNNGVIALFETELDVGKIEKELEEVDGFISGLNDRLATF